jgi:hypothetical protein
VHRDSALGDIRALDLDAPFAWNGRFPEKEFWVVLTQDHVSILNQVCQACSFKEKWSEIREVVGAGSQAKQPAVDRESIYPDKGEALNSYYKALMSLAGLKTTSRRKFELTNELVWGAAPARAAEQADDHNYSVTYEIIGGNLEASPWVPVGTWKALLRQLSTYNFSLQVHRERALNDVAALDIQPPFYWDRRFPAKGFWVCLFQDQVNILHRICQACSHKEKWSEIREISGSGAQLKQPTVDREAAYPDKGEALTAYYKSLIGFGVITAFSRKSFEKTYKLTWEPIAAIGPAPPGGVGRGDAPGEAEEEGGGD